MKALIRFSVALGLLYFLSVSCSLSNFLGRHVVETQQKAQPLKKGDIRLYVSLEKSFDPADILSAFDSTAAYQQAGRAQLLFVHGMGDYPERARYNLLFDRLPEKYDAGVVVFKWPAWIDVRTMPRINGREAAPWLFKTLRAWAADTLHRQRRVLMTHSMGAVVLRKMLEDYKGDLPAGFLDAVLIVAPETDLRGHARWLEKLDFAKSVYLFYNGEDQVLEPVEVYTHKERLGMRIVRADGSPEPLAGNTVYIDATRATDWHAYHLWRQNERLERLMRDLITGGPDPLNGLRELSSRVYLVPGEEHEDYQPFKASSPK